MKNLCVKLSGLGAALMCFPVIWRVHEGDALNPVSYLLWSMLSLVSTIVLLRAKKGGATLMAGYIFSDLAIAAYIFVHKGRYVFGAFEQVIVVMTMVCTLFYLRCKSKGNLTPSVILNALTILCAGIPQVVDIFEHPFHMSYFICVLYFLISTLSYYGEQPTLHARLIPGISILYWIVVVIGMMLMRNYETSKLWLP